MPSPAAAVLAAFRGALKSLQIFQRDRAGLEQIGDQQARGPAEQIEEIPNQSASVLALVDGGREQLRVADLLDLAQRAFLLEPVDERLNGRVRDLLVVGQAVEDLPDGAGSQFPALLQDSRFGFRETWFAHIAYLSRRCYDIVRSMARFVWNDADGCSRKVPLSRRRSCR